MTVNRSGQFQFLVRLQNASHRLETTTLTRPLARMIELLIRFMWSAYIPAGAKIDRTVHFEHNGLAVVINRSSVIGPKCRIGPQVVLGGKAPLPGAPELGTSVIVHSGAKLIGNIKIGNNCVIGANAVVINNIPANSVVVGIPGKIIKSGINIEGYTEAPE